MANELLIATEDNQQWISNPRTQDDGQPDWSSYKSLMKSRLRTITESDFNYSGLSTKDELNTFKNLSTIKEDDKIIIVNDENPEGIYITCGTQTEESRNDLNVQSIPNRQLIMGHSFDNDNVQGMSDRSSEINKSCEGLYVWDLVDEIAYEDCKGDESPFGGNSIKSSGVTARNSRYVDIGMRNLTSPRTVLAPNTFVDKTIFASFFYKRPADVDITEDQSYIAHLSLDYTASGRTKYGRTIVLSETPDKEIVIENMLAKIHKNKFTSDKDVLTQDEWNNIIIQKNSDDSFVIYINGEIVISDVWTKSELGSELGSETVSFVPFPYGEFKDVGYLSPAGLMISQFEMYSGSFDKDNDYDYLCRVDEDHYPTFIKTDISDNNLESVPVRLMKEVPSVVEFSMSPDVDSLDDNFEQIDRESYKIQMENDVWNKFKLKDPIYDLMISKYPETEKSGRVFQTKVTADTNFIMESGGITYLK